MIPLKGLFPHLPNLYYSAYVIKRNQFNSVVAFYNNNFWELFFVKPSYLHKSKKKNESNPYFSSSILSTYHSVYLIKSYKKKWSFIQNSTFDIKSMKPYNFATKFIPRQKIRERRCFVQVYPLQPQNRRPLRPHPPYRRFPWLRQSPVPSLRRWGERLHLEPRRLREG